MQTPPVVLTIAGSDSSAGAGIQADLKTFSALGAYGISAITTITAQNTQGITAVHQLPAEIIQAQIDTLCSDFEIAAVKIGALGDEASVNAVIDALKQHKLPNIVLDPVIIASSGKRLLSLPALAALREKLVPLTDLVTPNLDEACALIAHPPPINRKMMPEVARKICALGAKACLLKGGHLSGEDALDILDTGQEHHFFSIKKEGHSSPHGTGCTLSSAIAAHLALGYALYDAVSLSKRYLSRRLKSGHRLILGEGLDLLHHSKDLPK